MREREEREAPDAPALQDAEVPAPPSEEEGAKYFEQEPKKKKRKRRKDMTPEEKKKRRKRDLIIVGCVFGLIAVFCGICAIVSYVGYSGNFDYIATIEAVEYTSPFTLIDAEESDTGYYEFVASSPDDEFRILHLTDIHLGAGPFSAQKDRWALDAVRTVVQRVKADLVIVTGDLGFPVPYAAGTLNNKREIEMFGTLMEELDVYWTVCFGNHDTEIYSLSQLIEAAEENLGSSPLPLRICRDSLEPDSMNRALQQVGGGYINCTLSSDATALVYSPPLGMDMESGLSALSQAEELAGSLISQLTSEDMSQEEKARALYSWLCSHVEYDRRYYSDRASMPYESQTALGALRDGCAICGGYANALKLLFEKAGIPCFNVSGIYYGEYHMWNIASLDGRWLWFDATSDRGSDGQYGFLRFALEDLDRDKYQWDESFVQELTDGQADIEIRSPGNPKT